MKRINHFVFILCSVVCMGIVYACNGDDNKTLAAIDIREICGTYSLEQLKMTFNGEEMPALGNVYLTLNSSDDGNDDLEDGGSGKMFLKLPPFWPNLLVEGVHSVFDNVVIEVDAVTSPEQVTFEGGIKKPEYNLTIKGNYKDGIVSLDLVYTVSSQFTGKRYFFEFNKQSLNMGMLNPSIDFVEWGENQVPVEEFVKDAVAPVLEVIGRRLGGSLCLEFFTNASIYLGVKSNETGDIIQIPGKHGFRNLNGGFGYLATDSEGALFLSKTVSGNLALDSSLFTSIDGYFYYIPIFCVWGQSEDELRITFDTPIGNNSSRFLFQWLESLGKTELSSVEAEKVHKVALLLQEKKIKYIRLSGTAVQ